jgi:hypothetical protein
MRYLNPDGAITGQSRPQCQPARSKSQPHYLNPPFCMPLLAVGNSLTQITQFDFIKRQGCPVFALSCSISKVPIAKIEGSNG